MTALPALDKKPPADYVEDTILVGDDDPAILELLKHQLASWGYQDVGLAPNRDDFLRLLKERSPRAIILDFQFGDADGLELLREINALGVRAPIIFFSAFGTIERAVQAIKLGAFEFLRKPFLPERLRDTLSHAVQESRFREETTDPTTLTRPMIGCSPQTQGVLRMIDSVASTDAQVLITGESGTGKELVARAIHEKSSRRDGPFVAVNMAALPESLAESSLFGHERGAFTGASKAQVGLCEAAHKGTLFLDEIGETDLRLQPKLLRFLQEKVVQPVGSTTTRRSDARIVAATNRDCPKMIASGDFRADLYYRLRVVEIHLAPLRERLEDIGPLAELFLRQAIKRYSVSPKRLTREAIESLEFHDWLGNARELEHMMHQLAVMVKHEEITVEDLPAEVRRSLASSSAAGQSLLGTGADEGLRQIERIERAAIIDALEHSENRAVVAARLLGIGQATFYRKLKKYKLPLPRERPPQKPR